MSTSAGALRVLSSSGRRVPDDVAMVGYDDLGIAEHTEPPLATMRNPIGAMAEEAAHLLLAQLDGGSLLARRVVFPPTVVKRASA